MERTCKIYTVGFLSFDFQVPGGGGGGGGGVGAYVVLLTELLGERSAHDDTALGRGCLEVSGTALATGSRDDCKMDTVSIAVFSSLVVIDIPIGIA